MLQRWLATHALQLGDLGGLLERLAPPTDLRALTLQDVPGHGTGAHGGVVAPDVLYTALHNGGKIHQSRARYAAEPGSVITPGIASRDAHEALLEMLILA